MADPVKMVTREELRVLLEIDDDFLVSLEREEIVDSDTGSGYSPAMVERIRVCRNLHHELGVNLAGVEVALRLLETIRAERGQFREVLEWLGRELEAGRK